MKKYILLFTIVLCHFSLLSQDYKILHKKLKTYDKQVQFDSVDNDILSAVDYLLSHPYKEKSETYLYALKSMMTWMNGSKKYAIIIDGRLVKACGNDVLLLNLYMASMAKYLLAERYEKDRYILPDQEAGSPIMRQEDMWEIMFKGGEIFISYLVNESKMKHNRDLKKFIKAHHKGKLYEAMFK